jgi:hypothetical protein
VAAAQRKQASSAGDDGHVVGLAEGAHPVIDAMQAMLGAVGDRHDVLGLLVLAGFQGRADPGLAGVVPGGLDEQPAGQGAAGFGDRSLR